jgi:ubiquinone/menaquinone biosynthesis C-methylase UbiE
MHGELIDADARKQVLDHIPSPYQAHRELYRILKPGGSHVFTVPFSPVSGRGQCVTLVWATWLWC